MSFRIVDVEVGEPVPGVGPEQAQQGVALRFRDAGRPAGLAFVEPLDLPLDAQAVQALAVRIAGPGLVEERLRRALLACEGAREASASDAGRDVTVAVCTRDRPEDLETCLTTILAARGAGEAEILVVDNAPSDGRSEQVVSGHPGVRYVREPVAGLDVARNAALAHATRPWLAFVDDDVRVDPGWLEGLAAAVHDHPDAAAVTGLVLPAELRTEAQARFERAGGFGRGYRQLRWDGSRGPGTRLHPMGAGVFGAGCNMAFRTSLLRELGGFDEALDTGPPLPGGGDLDAFYRVLHAERVLVYEPRMAVSHRHRYRMDELRRQYYSWGTGFAAFLGARWAAGHERAQVVRMALWWVRYLTRQVRASLRDGDRAAARMALAEAVGGLSGLCGGYARSRRRMARRHATAGQR